MTALDEIIEYLEGIKERDNIPNHVITTVKNHLEIEKQQKIDFAKLHVTEALKQASEKVEVNSVSFTHNDYEIDKESILNAYPLDLIK